MLMAGISASTVSASGCELCHPEATFRPKDLSEESRQRIDQRREMRCARAPRGEVSMAMP